MSHEKQCAHPTNPQSYVKPALQDQGKMRLLTQGGPENVPENIVWGTENPFPVKRAPRS